MIVKYDSNNSGGGWWLDDKDWEALAEAGWNVHWVQPNKKWGGFSSPVEAYSDPLKPLERHEGREWLGGVATSAAKEFDSIDAARDEWQRVVRQDPDEEGCSCCGPPHGFFEERPRGD